MSRKYILRQCRFCADVKENDNLLKITSTDLVNLNEEIETFFKVRLRDVTSSQFICQDCCVQVESIFKFRDRVIKAQERLMSDPTKQILVKDEVDTDHSSPFIGAFVKCEPMVFDTSFIKSECTSDYDFSVHDDNELKITGFKTEANELPIENVCTNSATIDILTSTQNLASRIPTEVFPPYTELFPGHSESKYQVNKDLINYKWECTLCDFETTTDVKQLNGHYIEIHNHLPQYSCIECKRVIKSYECFKRHVQSHRNTVNRLEAAINRKKERQQRYRMENREKLRLREAERRKRNKYLLSDPRPSTTSSKMEWNKEDNKAAISKSSLSLEVTKQKRYKMQKNTS